MATNVINLADIYGKAQQQRATEQAMQLQDLQMQQAMQGMQQKRTLKDLVMSSYTPASPAVPFETDEEAFMGQPSLAGLTAKPAVRGGMNYDRLAQGLAGMGDFESMMKVQDGKTESDSKVSKAHQEKATAAQKFVDAGDAIGLERFVLADDETPDDVKVTSINKDGSMTMTSSAWPQPRTIKPSLDVQKMANGGADPYYQFFQSGDGFIAGNARTGQMAPVVSPDGGRFVGSASDPKLQGAIAGAKEEGKTIGEQRGNIGGKYQAIDSVRDAKKLIGDGIYSGFYGDIKKTLAKATPLVDKQKAANTEQFIAHIGNIVIPRLKEFGGNDSNEEMRYLQRVMAGDITMEDKALVKILDDTERKIQQGIERLNRGEQQSAPQTRGFTEGYTRTNRRTGEVQVFQGGQWQRQ